MFGFRKRKTHAVLRDLSASAAAQCARLHGAAFAHGWSAGEFERLSAAGNMLGDGAFSPAGALTGFVLSRRAADEAEILTIAVDAGQRRGGIGRALLACHLARLASLGTRQLFLEVEAENIAALALYKSYDFKQVGERQGYYRKDNGGQATALVLRRSLEHEL